MNPEASISSPASRKPLALLGLFGLTLGLRAVSLFRDCLSDDEAIYAVVAREMLRGRLLYRDVVDHKPPLIYLTYAATQALGGPRGGMLLVHLLTILVVFATALLVRRIVLAHGKSTDGRAAGVAAGLYIVFSTTLLDFDALAANCELFMLLPLVGSAAVYLGASASPRIRAGRLLSSGALVGVAALYKYQALVQLPLYLLHLAWVRRSKPGDAAMGIGAILLGTLAMFGAALAAFSLAGGLDAALFWLRFNFGYIQSGFEPQELVERALVRISFVAAAAALLYALGIRAMALSLAQNKGSDPLSRFASAWFLLSVVAVSAGGRFFGHYFHQLLPPLAILAAPGALQAWQARGAKRALVALGILVPALVFFLLGAFHKQMMEVAHDPDPDFPKIARFIDAHADPGDALCIWGNMPVLYFEAERPLGCRFVFANYLSGLSPATRTQSDPNTDASMNIVPEAWDMLEEDLRTRRPRLVIDASPGDVSHYGKFPPSRFPRLARILDRDYEEVAASDGLRLFRRRAP